MRIQQILGWIFLLGFIGLLIYKFVDANSGQSDSGVIMLLGLVVLLIILVLARKVLSES